MNGSPTHIPRETQVDMRLTRAPADTPRGRLHRAASIGARAGREAARLLASIPPQAANMRTLAKLGAERAAQMLVARRGPDGGQFGAYVVHTLYDGLDRMLGVLELFAQLDVTSLCDELTRTLVLLEVGEDRIAGLEAELADAQRDLAVERGLGEQARASLAAAQVRAMVRTEAAEQWDEPTRSRTMTDPELRVISDPDAQAGDLERYFREACDQLRAERDGHANTIAELRNVSTALYASCVKLVGHLVRQGNQVDQRGRLAEFRETLLRLGADVK